MIKELVILENDGFGEISGFDVEIVDDSYGFSAELFYSTKIGDWTNPGTSAGSLSYRNDKDVIEIELADKDKVLKLDWAQIETIGMLYHFYNRYGKTKSSKWTVLAYEED